MTRVCSLLIVSIVPLIAACGGDDGGSPVVPDAAPLPDARPLPDGPPSARVTEVVPCPGVVALAVTVVEPQPYRFGFTPDPGLAKPSVPVNSVVRFTMQRNHSVRSGVDPASATDLFRVPREATACFRFETVGEFPFYCDNHGPDIALHQGSLVVTAN